MPWPRAEQRNQATSSKPFPLVHRTQNCTRKKDIDIALVWSLVEKAGPEASSMGGKVRMMNQFATQ